MTWNYIHVYSMPARKISVDPEDWDVQRLMRQPVYARNENQMMRTMVLVSDRTQRFLEYDQWYVPGRYPAMPWQAGVWNYCGKVRHNPIIQRVLSAIIPDANFRHRYANEVLCDYLGGQTGLHSYLFRDT